MDRAKAREALLSLLTGKTSLCTIRELADAIARLDPAKLQPEADTVRKVMFRAFPGTTDAENAQNLVQLVLQVAIKANEYRERIRDALLVVLTGASSHWTAKELAEATMPPSPSSAALASGRQALLGMLPYTDPFHACLLALAVKRMEPTAADLAHIREALLKALAIATNLREAARLPSMIAQLDPSPADLARAREMLLNLLTSQSDPSTVQTLAQLDPSPADLARAREVLLNLLTSQSDPSTVQMLAQQVAQLDPSPADLARAREVLLNLLTSQSDPSTVRTLAQQVAQLDPSPADLARAREVLLNLLTSQSDPSTVRTLAQQVAQLDPSPADLARAREVLLNLLTSQTNSRIAAELTPIVAMFNPTAHDLSKANSWPGPPTEALLAIIRRNSALPDWLAAIQQFSGPLAWYSNLT